MRFFKKAMFIIAAVLFANSAHSVDGYKNMKFGMSKQDIIRMKPCALFPGAGAPLGVENQQCIDFVFAGSRVTAAFFFVEEKLERVGFMLEKNQMMGLFESLTKKYGPPSSSSTQAQLNAVDTTPNSSGFVAFDNNTVYLRFMSDATLRQSGVLIYTSPDYEEKVKAFQAAAANDDI